MAHNGHNGMAQNSLPIAGSGSNSSGYGLRDAHLTYAAGSSGRDQDAAGTVGIQHPGSKAAVNSAGSGTSQAWPPSKAGRPQPLQARDTAMESASSPTALPPRQQLQQQAAGGGYPQCQNYQLQGEGWQIMSPPSSSSSNGPGGLSAGHAAGWAATVAGCTPASPSHAAPGMQQQQFAQHVPYTMQQQQYPSLQQQQQVQWGQPPMQPRWDQQPGAVLGPIQLSQHSSSTAMHGRTQAPVLQVPQHTAAASTRSTAAQPWQRVTPAPNVAATAAAAGAGGGLASPSVFTAAAAAGDSVGTLRPVVLDRKEVHGVKVTCPMVLVATPSTGPGYGQDVWVPLHVDSMNCSVQCQINIAFVRMDLLFTYPAAQGAPQRRGKKQNKHDAAFFMPKTPDVTVTKIYTDKSEKPGHAYVTQVVASQPGSSGGFADDAQRHAEQAAFDLVLLGHTLAALTPGDSVKVVVEYMQPLHYDAQSNNYVLQLPTHIPGECLKQGLDVRDVLNCVFTVNTGTVSAEGLPEQPAAVSCNYHSEQDFVITHEDGCRKYEICKAQAWPASELLLSYSVSSRADTQASMQLLSAGERDAPTCTYPGMDTFLLSIVPPGREEVFDRFPRDVVFLLDRSSARTDDRRYMNSARTALLQCLDRMNLQDDDRLTVVDFNSQNAWWSSSLVQANRENVKRCTAWVGSNAVSAGSGNISSCLEGARTLLTASGGASTSGLSNTRLPAIIVMVDGAVDGERAICDMVEGWRPGAAPIPIITAGPGAQQQQQQPRQQQQQPRVFTFGVGECSQLFLKRLAAAGRGMCKIAVDVSSIKPAMEELLQAAGLPVLTDIQLQGLPAGRQYPRPIPDLCVGQPLVVTGCVPRGGLRQGQTILEGQTSGGGEWRLAVQVQAAGRAGMQDSVDQVAAYQELEFWTTEAWRLGATVEGKRTRAYQDVCARIVELSTRHNIPVKNFTELRSIEVKGNADQFYQHSLEQRVKLANSRRAKRTAEVLGGAAVVGTAVVAGVALGIAAGAADMGDLFSNAADMLASGGCEGCDGLIDLLASCPCI